MIKSIPIPTAGVSLGLAALGNLLQPYSPLMKYTCGILAAILLAMLLIKILRYPKLVHADMTGNPILGSVAATFFMTTMQLCVYIKDFAPFLCEAIWLAAVAAHAILIIWFSKNFMLNIFWFGFVAYMLLLALVTYRYLHHPIPEAAKPLICIYTAPMSLSLAGYFAVVPDKNFLLITVMQIAAQGLFFFILSLMPRLLRLPFYPSYAAFTFPFVITASALRLSLDYYARLGVVLHEFFQCVR